MVNYLFIDNIPRMITSIPLHVAELSLHVSKFFTKYHKTFRSYLTFTQATLSDPRAIGAACPSSPFLAKAMAEQVDINTDGYVIELGGGTGMITRALLERGVSPDKLITVEFSPVLAKHLHKEFPDIHVIEGDAGQLSQLLSDDVKEVHAIVSGLPLRSLPKPSVKAIKKQIYQLIDEKGFFIQFTYDLRLSHSQKNNFTLQQTQVVLRNIPPARINTYVKRLTQE